MEKLRIRNVKLILQSHFLNGMVNDISENIINQNYNQKKGETKPQCMLSLCLRPTQYLFPPFNSQLSSSKHRPGPHAHVLPQVMWITWRKRWMFLF